MKLLILALVLFASTLNAQSLSSVNRVALYDSDSKLVSASIDFSRESSGGRNSALVAFEVGPASTDLILLRYFRIRSDANPTYSQLGAWSDPEGRGTVYFSAANCVGDAYIHAGDGSSLTPRTVAVTFNGEVWVSAPYADANPERIPAASLLRYNACEPTTITITDGVRASKIVNMFERFRHPLHVGPYASRSRPVVRQQE